MTRATAFKVNLRLSARHRPNAAAAPRPAREEPGAASESPARLARPAAARGCR